MIEEYVPYDQRHDDFYERFLEQRIGKSNSFTEPLAANPILFPIRPIPAAPAAAPHKRGRITSSDSGVGSPSFFANPTHYSWTTTTTSTGDGDWTAVNFGSNQITYSDSTISTEQSKKPKYFRPQPYDPNSQSVLRTLTRQGYKL